MMPYIFIFYLVQSGTHNRPPHPIMSNNHAEKHGESILHEGASMIDNIRNQKRTWNTRREQSNPKIGGNKNTTFDSNTKRKKFMRPVDDST